MQGLQGRRCVRNGQYGVRLLCAQETAVNNNATFTYVLYTILFGPPRHFLIKYVSSYSIKTYLFFASTCILMKILQLGIQFLLQGLKCHI